MLNLVGLTDIPEPTELAEPTVVRSRMGIWLSGTHMPVPRGHVKEPDGPARAAALAAATAAFVRPQASTKAVLFGNGTQVAGLVKSAGQQPISKVNYAYTTRIAALKGCGALGPHPARDPV
jgi:hypothetical protein